MERCGKMAYNPIRERCCPIGYEYEVVPLFDDCPENDGKGKKQSLAQTEAAAEAEQYGYHGYYAQTEDGAHAH
jgi:hypothetical protein